MENKGESINIYEKRMCENSVHSENRCLYTLQCCTRVPFIAI